MLKSIIKGTGSRFRSEELLFGLMTLLTILIDYDSPVPAMVTCCLLAFYYMFFSWMMFSTKLENHVWFSLVSGVAYSLCLICMAIIIGALYKGTIFLFFQSFILAGLGGYLYYQKLWGIYKGNHYIRIGLIIFLNVYILLFK